MGMSVSVSMGAPVIGLDLFFANHVSMELLSYVKPSVQMTGSVMRSNEMGSTNSSGCCEESVSEPKRNNNSVFSSPPIHSSLRLRSFLHLPSFLQLPGLRGFRQVFLPLYFFLWSFSYSCLSFSLFSLSSLMRTKLKIKLMGMERVFLM